MAGPWEDFQTPAAPASSGPWSDFQNQDQPITVGGTVKAIGSGAAVGAARIPHDVLSLINLARRGYSDLTGGSYDPAKDDYSAGEAYDKFVNDPNSLYTPKNAFESGVKSVSQYAPALAVGPEGLGLDLAGGKIASTLASRAVRQAAIPAAASSVASSAAQGTPLEPYAGPLAGLAAGGVAIKTGAASDARAAAAAAQLKNASPSALTQIGLLNKIAADTKSGDSVRQNINSKLLGDSYADPTGLVKQYGPDLQDIANGSTTAKVAGGVANTVGSKYSDSPLWLPALLSEGLLPSGIPLGTLGAVTTAGKAARAMENLSTNRAIAALKQKILSDDAAAPPGPGMNPTGPKIAPLAQPWGQPPQPPPPPPPPPPSGPWGPIPTGPGPRVPNVPLVRPGLPAVPPRPAGPIYGGAPEPQPQLMGPGDPGGPPPGPNGPIPGGSPAPTPLLANPAFNMGAPAPQAALANLRAKIAGLLPAPAARPPTAMPDMSGIQMPANRPAGLLPAPVGSTWSTGRVERMNSLLAQGLSTREVAQRLGVTKNAVIGQSNRMRNAAPAAPSVPQTYTNGGQAPAAPAAPVIRKPQTADNSVIPAAPSTPVLTPQATPSTAKLTAPPAMPADLSIPDFLKRSPVAAATPATAAPAEFRGPLHREVPPFPDTQAAYQQGATDYRAGKSNRTYPRGDLQASYDRGTQDAMSASRPQVQPPVINKLTPQPRPDLGGPAFAAPEVKSGLQELLDGIGAPAAPAAPALGPSVIEQGIKAIAQRQGGISTVFIGDLAKEMGLPVDALKEVLPELARRGDVNLHSSSTTRMSPQQQAGAITVGDRTVHTVTMGRPTAPSVPVQPPVITKLTKKNGGAVKATPQDFGNEAPFPDKKTLTPQPFEHQIASDVVSSMGRDLPPGVAGNIHRGVAANQAAIGNRIQQASQHLDITSTGAHGAAALAKVATIRGLRRQDDVKSYIQNLIEQNPRQARALSTYFGPKWIDSIWSKKTSKSK